MGLGPIAVVILLAVLSLGLSIGAVVDALRRPDSAWAAAGQNKTAWVLILAVSIFLSPIGLAVAIVYFASIRPKLRPAG